MKKTLHFDVEFINPLGYPGTLVALCSDSVEKALSEAPFWLSASSQWRPDQFKVVSAKLSKNQPIKEDTRELR